MNIAGAINKFVNSKNPAQSGFMPLDVLIRNQNVLYASDNLHRMLSAGEKSVSAEPGERITTIIAKFTSINSGTCNIKLAAKHFNYINHYTSGYITFKKNGEQIKRVKVEASSYGASAADIKFDNVSFNIGDTFTIELECFCNSNNSYAYIVDYKDIGIYGDITTGIFITE